MEGHPGLHWLSYTAGALMIALSMLDVFMTVLYARAGRGPISLYLGSGLWGIFRRASRLFPRFKSMILAFCGPTALVVLIFFWIGLLVMGFTLLDWPAMGSGITSSSGPTNTDFWSAFYFAGGSLTTVGSSDVRPVTAFFKFVCVIDSLLGICVVTLTLSYVIQIYTALQRRNALALGLHHASGGTGDAAVLLAALGPGDDFRHAESQLAGFAAEVTGVYESHHFFSALVYFRFEEPYYAMARGALVSLELLSLIDTALDDSKHGWVKRSASFNQLQNGGMHVLKELSDVYLPHGAPDLDAHCSAAAAQWKRRYLAAVHHLQGQGISVVADLDRGAERYVQQRRQWDPYITAFTAYMEHTIEEIDPTVADPAETAHHREMPTPPLPAEADAHEHDADELPHAHLH